MSYDEYEDNNGPKALREALEKANAKVKELEKDNGSLKGQVADLSKSVKSQSITSILREKSVPPALAKWLEKDDVEPTAEAVDAWLKENGELFNLKPAEAKQAEPEVEPEAEESLDPAYAEELALSQSLDSLGQSRAPREINQAIADLSDDLSPAEGVAQLKALGLLG